MTFSPLAEMRQCDDCHSRYLSSEGCLCPTLPQRLATRIRRVLDAAGTRLMDARRPKW